MYHEIQIKKGVKYHYLVENIRYPGGWKKIRLYIGKGNLTKKMLSNLIRKNKNELNRKKMKMTEKVDPLSHLLSSDDVSSLEKIRKNTKHAQQKWDSQKWQNFYEWFVTEFTYNTSAIEGSTVTLQETGMILFDNIVPEGRTTKEIREIENHKDSFDYMFRYKKDMTKQFVLGLHKKLMHNILWKQAGAFRDVNVYVRGANFMPPRYEDVEKEFKKLMLWYRTNKKKYHPVIIAAYFHHRFETVHPFRDGNGRTGRLILNFMLKKSGYPMIDIKNAERQKYYHALHEANEGNLEPMVNLIKKYLTESLEKISQ